MQRTMSKKIQIRKEELQLPIKTNLDNIHYVYNFSNKKFENKISHINDNLDIITTKIREFIELLNQDSRKNDENISEKIYESLQQIFKIASKDISIDFNKLKQKLFKELNSCLTLSKNTKIKTQIEKYIENIKVENNKTAPKSATSNKKSTTTHTKKTIDKKLPKEYTCQLYKNLLLNSIFISKINKKIKDTCSSVLHDLKIKNISKSNLNPTKTNKKVLQLFLKNYNSKVQKTIIETKKSIDKEHIKIRSLDNIIGERIRSIKSRLKKQINFFMWNINPLNQLTIAKHKFKKLQRIYGKFFGTTFSILGIPFFLFRIPFLILTSLPFKIISSFSSWIIKKAFNIVSSTVKISLSIISKMLKLTTFVLKGTFKIMTKTLGLVINITKSIFNITKGITKFVAKSVFKALHPLKYLKYLLLTPQGMYIAGLICGFIVKKIIDSIQWLKENGGKEVSVLGEKLKDSVLKLKDKLLNKINLQITNLFKRIINRHKKILNEDLSLEKDIFGIPRINVKDNYKKSLKQIENKIYTRFEPYLKILSTDNDLYKKIEDIKIQLEKNDKKENKEIEKIKKIGINNFKDILLKLQKWLDDIQKNKIFNILLSFSTSIGENMIHTTKKTLLSAGANLFIQTAGIAIGSCFGGLSGSIVGGFIGGVVGQLAEYLIAKLLKRKMTSKEHNDIEERINGELISLQLRNQNGYIEYYDKYSQKLSEIRHLFKIGEINEKQKNERKIEAEQELINKELEISKNKLTPRIFFGDIARRRIESLDNSQLVCGDINKLISYINSGKENNIKKFDLVDKIKKRFDGQLFDIVNNSLEQYSKIIKLSLYEYVRLAENNFLTYENNIPKLPESIKEHINQAENTNIFNLRNWNWNKGTTYRLWDIIWQLTNTNKDKNGIPTKLLAYNQQIKTNFGNNMSLEKILDNQMKNSNRMISGVSQEFGNIIKQLIKDIDSDTKLTIEQKTLLKFYLINNNIKFLQEMFIDGLINSDQGEFNKIKIKEKILQKINDQKTKITSRVVESNSQKQDQIISLSQIENEKLQVNTEKALNVLEELFMNEDEKKLYDNRKSCVKDLSELQSNIQEIVNKVIKTKTPTVVIENPNKDTDANNVSD